MPYAVHGTYSGIVPKKIVDGDEVHGQATTSYAPPDRLRSAGSETAAQPYRIGKVEKEDDATADS